MDNNKAGSALNGSVPTTSLSFDDDSSLEPSARPGNGRRGSLPTDLSSTDSVALLNTEANSGLGGSSSSIRRHGHTSNMPNTNNHHRTVEISSQLRFPRSIMVTHVDDVVFDQPAEKARFAQMFKNIDPQCTVLFFKTFNRVRVDFMHHQAAANARRMMSDGVQRGSAWHAAANAGGGVVDNNNGGGQHHVPSSNGSLGDGRRSQSTDTLFSTMPRNNNNNDAVPCGGNMKCIWFFNILQEMNLDSTLKPPKLEKQFLISPPASPPVDWEPVTEFAPVIDYNVLSAIASLGPGQAHELHPSGGDEHPAIVFHPCADAQKLNILQNAGDDEGDDANNEFSDEYADTTTADGLDAAGTDASGRPRQSGAAAAAAMTPRSDNGRAQDEDDGDGVTVAGAVNGKRARRRMRIKIVSESSYTAGGGGAERSDSMSDRDDDTASNASSASSSPSRRRNVAMRIGNHRVIPHTRRPPIAAQPTTTNESKSVGGSTDSK